MKLTNPYNLTICYINIMKLLNSYVRLALWVEHQLRNVMVVGSNLTCDTNIFSYVVFMSSLCRLYVVSMSSLCHLVVWSLAAPPNVLKKPDCFLLDPEMDASERISKLQTNLHLLRKTYQNLKSELSVIERRRKKIRRKERERADKSRDVEVAA